MHLRGDQRTKKIIIILYKPHIATSEVTGWSEEGEIGLLGEKGLLNFPSPRRTPRRGYFKLKLYFPPWLLLLPNIHPFPPITFILAFPRGIYRHLYILSPWGSWGIEVIWMGWGHTANLWPDWDRNVPFSWPVKSHSTHYEWDNHSQNDFVQEFKKMFYWNIIYT